MEPKPRPAIIAQESATSAKQVTRTCIDAVPLKALPLSVHASDVAFHSHGSYPTPPVVSIFGDNEPYLLTLLLRASQYTFLLEK